MKTIQEIKNIENLVNEILREDIRARNDDKYLTFRVLQQILTGERSSELLSMSLNDIKKLPAFETVKRVRAKIQNKEKLFLPSSAAVRHRRRIREEDFRAWASGKQKYFFS